MASETAPSRTRCEQTWRAALAGLAVALARVAVSCTSSEPAQPQYTDEELGLDEIVDKKMVSGVLMFAQHRTLEERDRDRPDPLGGSGHERERNFFEHNMRWLLPLLNPQTRSTRNPTVTSLFL